MVENVHSIAAIAYCATHQRSSPAPQSAPPSTQHTPPHSHITLHLPISTTQTNNHIPDKPPANMANPREKSDVAARFNLATLSAAVVQRPLVASKMSTALLTPPPAQRISAHLQRHKARLFQSNTHTPTSTSHPISQYQQLNKKITYLCLRLRLWPILAQAVTSLRDNLLPR